MNVVWFPNTFLIHIPVFFMLMVTISWMWKRNVPASCSTISSCIRAAFGSRLVSVHPPDKCPTGAGPEPEHTGLVRFFVSIPRQQGTGSAGEACLARQLLFTTNPCFQTVVSDPLVFWWQHTRWTKTKRWKKKIFSLQKMSWSGLTAFYSGGTAKRSHKCFDR